MSLYITVLFSVWLFGQIDAPLMCMDSQDSRDKLYLSVIKVIVLIACLLSPPFKLDSALSLSAMEHLKTTLHLPILRLILCGTVSKVRQSQPHLTAPLRRLTTSPCVMYAGVVEQSRPAHWLTRLTEGRACSQTLCIMSLKLCQGVQHGPEFIMRVLL